MIGIGILVWGLSAYVTANAHFVESDAAKVWSFVLGIAGAAVGGAVMHYGFAALPHI